MPAKQAFPKAQSDNVFGQVRWFARSISSIFGGTYQREPATVRPSHQAAATGTI